MPPTPGDSFQTAKIEVVADASELKAGLEQAKAQVEGVASEMEKMGDKADAATKQASAGIQDMAIKMAATITVIIAAVDAFVKLYDKADDFFSGGGDFKLNDPAGSPKERVAELRREIEKLKETVSDRGLLSRVGDAAEFYLGIKSGRTKALEDIAKDEKRINEQASIDRRESAKKEAERIEEQSLEGIEAIEAKRARRIAEAKKKYQDAADPVINAINSRADKEVAEWKELQDKKTKIELDEIEKRRNAYMDLIYKQQAATIASNEKIAEAAAKAMEQAFAKVAQGFNSLFDLRQLTQTLDALTANVDKIANQRRAAGL